MITVTCKNCKYKWQPEPEKWRNFANLPGTKLLKCPVCFTWNEINVDETQVAVILDERKKPLTSSGSEKHSTEKTSFSEPPKQLEEAGPTATENSAGLKPKTPATGKLMILLKKLEKEK